MVEGTLNKILGEGNAAKGDKNKANRVRNVIQGKENTMVTETPYPETAIISMVTRTQRKGTPTILKGSKTSQKEVTTKLKERRTRFLGQATPSSVAVIIRFQAV